MSLKREPFLTMFYTISLSLLLVNKWGFMLITILSNYQNMGPLPAYFCWGYKQLSPPPINIWFTSIEITLILLKILFCQNIFLKLNRGGSQSVTERYTQYTTLTGNLLPDIIIMWIVNTDPNHLQMGSYINAQPISITNVFNQPDGYCCFNVRWPLQTERT